MDTFLAPRNGQPSMKRFILREPAILRDSTFFGHNSAAAKGSVVAEFRVSETAG